MDLWWNPGGTRGTLVEPYLKPPRTTPQPLQMVEPWWNHGGTLMKPFCQGRGPPRSLSRLRPQSFQLLGETKTPSTPGAAKYQTVCTCSVKQHMSKGYQDKVGYMANPLGFGTKQSHLVLLADLLGPLLLLFLLPWRNLSVHESTTTPHGIET